MAKNWGIPERAEPFAVVVFFIVWTAGMTKFLRFWWLVAPAAVERWVRENGYELLFRNEVINPFLRFRHANNSSYWLGRVSVRDAKGKVREGLVRVGRAWWFSWSVDRCPVVPVAGDLEGHRPAKLHKAAGVDPDFA